METKFCWFVGYFPTLKRSRNEHMTGGWPGGEVRFGGWVGGEFWYPPESPGPVMYQIRKYVAAWAKSTTYMMKKTFVNSFTYPVLPSSLPASGLACMHLIGPQISH